MNQLKHISSYPHITFITLNLHLYNNHVAIAMYAWESNSLADLVVKVAIFEMFVVQQN